jgi:hypothetical protein
MVFLAKRHRGWLNVEQIPVYLRRKFDTIFTEPEFEGPNRDVNTSLAAPPTP